MISVIICTYDRADLLERTMRSLLAQEDAPPLEVIVVDNNSSDRTQSLLAEWRRRGTLALQCIVEKAQGLSHARNAGIGAARGGLVAFVDDDVVLPEGWARRLSEAFAEHPDAACVAGPCEPEYEVLPPPPWATDELLGMIAPGHFGRTARVLLRNEYPAGGNMAVRRSALAQTGGFNPALGHAGDSLLGAEEVEFIQRLRRNGGKVWYEPALRVHHYVPAARVTPSYLLARRRWDGRSIARWECIAGGKWFLLGHALLRALIALPRDVIGWACLTAMGRPDHRFTLTCRIAKNLAYLDQARLILLGRA